MEKVVTLMTSTIVLQSHKYPLPESWLNLCINSVKHWAAYNQFDYQLIGDELFDYLTQEILYKTKDQKVIATDLARLKLLQDYLERGYETVIWCDADFLIFEPEKFSLPESSYAIGREVWIQDAVKTTNKLISKVKVHNAFLMFRHQNNFLNFYTETAERLIALNTGTMPPQYIGPKLLTALHNIAQCPVLESAGMLSPLVINDIAKGDGPALRLFQKDSPHEIYAANLCQSLFNKGKVNTPDINQCINTLLNKSSL